MKIHLIVATDRNGGIGRDGQIPWRIPNDTAFFKRTTIGEGRNAVIMGRKTWDSLPKRQGLPDRINLVISHRQNPPSNTTAVWLGSIEEAIFWCTEHEAELDDVFIIGGELVYNTFMTHFVDIVESVYVTRIDDDYKCDQFFGWDDEDLVNMGFDIEDEKVEFHDEVAVQYTHFVR